MKILAIRLKNLTSIEGTVEVDFTAEPLMLGWYIRYFWSYGSGKVNLVGRVMSGVV